MKESHNKAVNKWRNSKYQLCVTVPAEIKELLEDGARREKKSKAQYITDLIKKDNEK